MTLQEELANDDADAVAHLAHKGECHGAWGYCDDDGVGDVGSWQFLLLLLQVVLQREERRLEKRAHAHTNQDLEQHDTHPAPVRRECNEQPESDRLHNGSDTDYRAVPFGFLNVQRGAKTSRRQRSRHAQEPDPRVNRQRLQCGLEVEG